ncbi:MAG: DUF1343 domain-containing protein [Candidatus Neomarinimicrobiota bacterium]
MNNSSKYTIGICAVTAWLAVLSFAQLPTRQIPVVKPGINVLITEKMDLIRGKRLGLITNPTGVNSKLESTIDILAKNGKLVALFGPEHGVRGDVFAGETIDNFVDARTGVPVYSLYGKTHQPTPEMLKNVDALVYDIQDIGNRTYTYIYTMARSMSAAKDANIPFIVLDRPNPLGGELVEGPVLDPAFKSGIGMFPIPYLYGLTAGELARYFNTEFGINCNLTVVPMKGWNRKMNWSDTGLEWILTSPHIPHWETAYHCAATGGIGEMPTVNIGVGYTLPFELVGEEWINAEQLATELNSRHLPGVVFRPLHFRPYYLSRKDVPMQGVQIHIVNFRTFKPIETQIHILTALRKLYPDQPLFDAKRVASFNKAFGTDSVQKMVMDNLSAEQILASWQKEVEAFKTTSQKYYLYQ